MRTVYFVIGVALLPLLMGLSRDVLKDVDVPSSRWLIDILRVQDERLNISQGRRLVFVGGSSTLFGIDAKLIEAETGVTTLNLGTHAGYSLSFHAARLRGMLREGDVVVAQFENAVYLRSSTSDFEQRQQLIWGRSIRELSAGEFFRTIRDTWEVPGETILELLIAKFLHGTQQLEFDSLAGLKSAMAARPRGQPALSGTIYSWQRMDETGSIIVPGFVHGRALRFHNEKAGHNYKIVEPDAVADKFFRDAEYLREVVTSQQGTLYFVNPPTLRTVGGAIAESRRRESYAAIARSFASRGFNFACAPGSSILRHTYFFDSEYHLNAWGAAARALDLAACLNPILHSGGTRTNPEPADNGGLEILRARLHKGEPLYSFERRYRDLAKVRDALQEFREKNGQYPESVGWDGVATNWGKADPVWIEGLVPEYLAQLPRDPRNTLEPEKQYLYRSNGDDYKLITHGPDDCDALKALASDLIDPVRDCWGYGIWTRRAMDW